jgi:membrane-associated phospholipid phosphatase
VNISARLKLIKFPLLLLIGFLIVININIYAQGDTLTNSKPSSKNEYHRTPSTIPDWVYFKSWLIDSRDIVIAPVRWNKYQWIAFSGVTVVTAFLMTQDASIQKITQNNQKHFLDVAARSGLQRLGSGTYSIPALALLYGVGAIRKDDKEKYTALKGLEAFALGSVAAQVLKQLTHRDRPYMDNPPDPFQWYGPFHAPSNSSFPSGHSTVAFAMATVVATSYSKTIWVPILCYTFAGLTALSRVYQNDHWFSDVFVGSALGFAIGKTIINNQMKRLKIIPVSPNGMGVTVFYQL